MITATHSAAEMRHSVSRVFREGYSKASTDLDKNGRTSILEVFSAVSMAVKQHYEQRGQLATEHALIDDNGDGVGRESRRQVLMADWPGRCISMPSCRRLPTTLSLRRSFDVAASSKPKPKR